MNLYVKQGPRPKEEPHVHAENWQVVIDKEGVEGELHIVTDCYGDHLFQYRDGEWRLKTSKFFVKAS